MSRLRQGIDGGRVLGDDAIEDWYVEKIATSVASTNLVLAQDVIACRGFTLSNPQSNSDVIYIRHTTTNNDTLGFELNPGESRFVGVKDPKKVWFQAKSNTPNLEVIVQ